MLFLTLIFVLLPLSDPADDSSRVFRLHDVVVTGTRSAVPVQELPSPVQVMDSAGLEQMNGASLADKLKQVAGLHVRSYGGNGSLQSVSIRGMGSDYALILLNGIRFTTFQISTVDLGIFSGYDIERIEVANGGSSALYGADAVGGVINIMTKRPTGRKFASIAQRTGSFGLSGLTAAAGGGGNGVFIRGSAEILRASNSFDFLYNDGRNEQRLKRTGADFLSKSVSISLLRIFSENIVTALSARYADAERGQPSAVTGPEQTNAARIHDKDLFFHASTELNVAESMALTMPIAFHNNRQTYFDPAIVSGGQPLDAYYDNTIVTAAPFIRFDLSPDHSLTAGSELVAASILSNELFPSRRQLYSGYLSSRHRISGPVEFNIFPSLRYDAFSDIEGGLSSKLGVNAGLLDDPVIRIRGSYGRNYRVPTFNDLYWINGGNPLLTPEHSLNGDAGVIIGVEQDELAADIDVGYFWIDAVNKIVWQPGAQNRWTPVNIQSVSSSGLEVCMTMNALHDLVMVKYHHSFLRTVKTSAEGPNDASANKILPFTPQEIATISVGSSVAGLSANILYTFTGFRYETADNDPRYILPTVETMDVNVSYRISLDSFSFRIKAEVNNLLNMNYQLITGYPMPLRNYIMTTEFSL